jgi:hypothetical protein
LWVLGGKVQFMAAAAFTYGVLLGQIAAQCDKLQTVVVEVAAVQWKSKLRLRGASKDDSRELAKRLFPGCSTDFRCALHASMQVLSQGWLFYTLWNLDLASVP